MGASSDAPQVQVGDRVRLKSGGPVMTAERVMHQAMYPFAQCTWIDARERMNRAFVNLDALALVFPEDEPVP